MSDRKTVTIIGGGIAGLSAAVFLNEKDFKVTLIESSPKLGGRAYSFFDNEKQMFFDNGQHILAGWYKNTFEYLKIIGSYAKLNFQKELEIHFIDTQKKIYKLKCTSDSAPVNLLKGLLKFKVLNIWDKLALKNIYSLLSADNEYEKYSNVRELLKAVKQTENLIRYFWEPFVLAVFNTMLEKVSVKIFLNVLRTGFNDENNSLLVIPEVNLNELLVNDAVDYFEKNNVNVILGKEVNKIIIKNDRVEGVLINDDQKISSDFYISAVSFFAFRRLFDEIVYEENKFMSEMLKPSSIVSVHLFFEEKISEDLIPYNSFGMTGLIGTIVQWIFKRSQHQLSLVISGADYLQITEMEHEKIFDLCVSDLEKTIDGFSKQKISGYRVIKEKRATFIPDSMSNELRLKQKTKYDNFFIAGDWTDTGLPATIEGAVTSAKTCSELILSIRY